MQMHIFYTIAFVDLELGLMIFRFYYKALTSVMRVGNEIIR